MTGGLIPNFTIPFLPVEKANNTHQIITQLT